MTQPAPHVVLLGDSVFDNARYVAPGPDVAAQLRAVTARRMARDLTRG